MKKLIEFLLALEKSRKTYYQISINNKTITLRTFADHAFLEALFSLVLAREEDLDLERLLKLALVINIYKSSGSNEKFNKITSCLPKDIKSEVRLIKDRYNNQKTKMDKLFKQISLVEKLISFSNRKDADIYLKKILPDINDIKLKKIAESIYREKFTSSKRKKPKDECGKIAKFLILSSKLQSFKRRGWVLRGVKDAETVAQHTFHFMVSSWVLGLKKGFDPSRMISLALIHDLCEVYAGDRTPHDPLKNITKDLLKNPPRLPKKQKIEWLMQKKQAEWRGISKITEMLPVKIAKEIKMLWLEFEERLTKEGRFSYLLDKVENIFQATNYWVEDNSFPITAWWISMKEIIDDDLLLKLVNALDDKFRNKLLKLNGK